MYAANHYDLAASAVGVVERAEILGPQRVKAGDVAIGLQSSGLHSNGYSLARKVIFEKLGLKCKSVPKGFKKDIGSVLMTPTRIYVRPVLSLLKKCAVLGMAHITGGGIPGNGVGCPCLLRGATPAVVELQTVLELDVIPDHRKTGCQPVAAGPDITEPKLSARGPQGRRRNERAPRII